MAALLASFANEEGAAPGLHLHDREGHVLTRGTSHADEVQPRADVGRTVRDRAAAIRGWAAALVEHLIRRRIEHDEPSILIHLQSISLARRRRKCRKSSVDGTFDRCLAPRSNSQLPDRRAWSRRVEPATFWCVNCTLGWTRALLQAADDIGIVRPRTLEIQTPVTQTLSLTSRACHRRPRHRQSPTSIDVMDPRRTADRSGGRLWGVRP